MDVLGRLKMRTKEEDDSILLDCMESAKAAILARRFPYATDYPDEVEARYLDLQYRCALAIYNKDGADFETVHKENGIERSWGSEGIPTQLLQEVVPYVGVMVK